MLLAQAATQPVTVEQWSDVKMALGGLIVLVLGALGVALVAVIKAVGAYIEAKLATKSAENTNERLSRTNARVDTALVNTPPPGTGTGTGGNFKAGGTLTILLLLLLPIIGCQGKEISVALKTYTATAQYLTAEYDAGRIPQEQWDTVVAPAGRTAFR